MTGLPWPAPAASASPSATKFTGTRTSSGRIYFWQAASLWIGVGRGRTQWQDRKSVV